MSQIQVGQINSTDGSTAITTGDDGYVSFAKTQIGGRRNLIINGAMQVAQRGTSVFTPASSAYSLDRWKGISDPGSKFTIQQNAGSVTPPSGFSKYLGVTSTSTYTLGSADYNILDYRFEGQDTVNLAWGTSDAKDITVSFWVRSSLTGQFSFIVYNAASGATKRYCATYSISSANTWEYKTVTIPGDTTESWGDDNTLGMLLRFNMGTGSTYGSGTANTWQTGTIFGTSGDNSIVSTNGATWYLTGVQLEVGSVATPFEHRSYGEELALCQRYYEKRVVRAASSSWGLSSSETLNRTFTVTKRAAPTISYTGSWGGTTPGGNGGNTDSMYWQTTSYFYSDNTATEIFDAEL